MTIIAAADVVVVFVVIDIVVAAGMHGGRSQPWYPSSLSLLTVVVSYRRLLRDVACTAACSPAT
jgi:hypothetical protein